MKKKYEEKNKILRNDTGNGINTNAVSWSSSSC